MNKGTTTTKRASKREKNRLPEKQSIFVNNVCPKNDKQKELINSIERNEITIAVGPAGVGKSYVALATALALLGETYKKLIIVKSVTTLPGEEVGFIKGDLASKMEPFMLSFTWNIDKIAGEGAAKSLIDKKLIEILPLAFIRGISIDDSIVVLDEVQNFSHHTFKTIMTRIGNNSKYILLGDIEQVDRKKKSESCLEPVLEIFKDNDIIGTVEFTDEDCVRNPIIPKILHKLRENGL